MPSPFHAATSRAAETEGCREEQARLLAIHQSTGPGKPVENDTRLPVPFDFGGG